jgi:hypothetical protein
MTTVLLKMQSTLLLFVWDAAAQREPALHEVKIELFKISKSQRRAFAAVCHRYSFLRTGRPVQLLYVGMMARMTTHTHCFLETQRARSGELLWVVGMCC